MNKSDDEKDQDYADEENQLDEEQVREAKRLTQLVTGDDPVAAFKMRAEMRERYHDATVKMAEAQKEIEENDNIDMFDDAGCDELEAALMQADKDYDNMGASGKELACDGEFLLSMSNLLLARMQKFHMARAERVLRPKELATKLRILTEREADNPEAGPLRIVTDDPDMNDLFDDKGIWPDLSQEESAFEKAEQDHDGLTVAQWATIGRRFCHVLRMPSSLEYIRPLQQNTKPLPLKIKTKKERAAKEEKTLAKMVELKEKDKDHDDPEQSVTRELDAIRKCIRSEFKRCGTYKLCYYSFVIDPKDFSKSIENMFYTSFLVKDGFIRIDLDEQSGLPEIELVSDNERSTLNVKDASTVKSHQAIVGFSYDVWENMVESLEIKEAAIHR